jgi:hypothetical protein
MNAALAPFIVEGIFIFAGTIKALSPTLVPVMPLADICGLVIVAVH